MQDVAPFAAAAVLFVCLSASLRFWLRAAQRLRAGQPLLVQHPHPPPVYNPLILAGTLAWITMQLLSRLTSEWSGVQPEATLQTVQATCAVNALTLLLGLPILTSGGRHGTAEFGISACEWPSQVRAGGMGFVASVLPVALVRFATFPLQDSEPEHAFLKTLLSDPQVATIAWIALAAVVLAPLTEEFLYRVVLQGWLQTRLPPRTALLAASAIFAGVHPLADAPALFPLALVLGYVYQRRHSYWAAVVVHALFNAANLLLALALTPSDPFREG